MTDIPENEPYETGRLAVSGGHELYWERCGKRGGIPLVFLHGGPGSGCTARHRRLFDPDVFDVLLFDQRGAGRSTPHLSLEDNTTPDLVADIEALREHLGVERWIVVGPSWGSCLALVYAETHPDRVSGLVPEGVFLGSEAELGWMHDEQQVPRAFPDARADFISQVPYEWRNSVNLLFAWAHDAMKAELEDGMTVLKRLDEADSTLAELRRSTLYRWTEYEDRLSYLERTPEDVFASLKERGSAYVAAHSMIEMHYFRHGCFLERDQIIRDARHLDGIPMHIVHSRYDMVCPAESAFRLAEACPHARLHLIPVNGHAMTDAVQPVLNTIMAELAEAVSAPAG